jgi:glycosyltransferase involved in cell wall biosynthesis
MDLTRTDSHSIATAEDIVFSCPQMPYAFDEKLYRTQGMGGSETALIEMARWLRRKTSRPVKVFNHGIETTVAESGVEWGTARDQEAYFVRNRPKVHIAWRHNIRLTDARTYLWCHDLLTETVAERRNFDSMLCLSEYHKVYVHRNQFVPSRKIIVTRNGIDPSNLTFQRPRKNPNKFLWMSSPDRGLKSALRIMDVVTKELPEVELHVYYGFHLLRLYGLATLAGELEGMIKERAYVKYHGFTEKAQMYREAADAVIWLYPCNYLETFCIAALEMQALGVFPVTRRFGALADTLREAERNGSAILLEYPTLTQREIERYSAAVFSVLRGKLWERVSLDLEKNSWASIAGEWIDLMRSPEQTSASALHRKVLIAG